jgi:nucleoid DNA-binding protein
MKPAAFTEVNGKWACETAAAAGERVNLFQFGTFRLKGAARRQHLI